MLVKNASLSKEIAVTAVNKVGVLADMTEILAAHSINLLAMAGYATEQEAKIMMVTGDNLRAAEVLKKQNYKTLKENEVVIVDLENRTGALKNLAAILAEEKIDVKYIYGSSCTCGGPSMIVMSTSDNEKALAAIKTK